MPITKRPCGNCPFRCDGSGIELKPGRLEEIVSGLLADDHQTFVCHKTLGSERMTCAGAVAVLTKLGRMPVIARVGLATGVITRADIEASSELTIGAQDLDSRACVATNQAAQAAPSEIALRLASGVGDA